MTLGFYALAAMLEIAGCFAVWAWARGGASALWLVPGTLALLAFAWLLSRSEAAFAGRAYAAYGGVYVAASLLWLWAGRGAEAGPLGPPRRGGGARGRLADPARTADRLIRCGRWVVLASQ